MEWILNEKTAERVKQEYGSLDAFANKFKMSEDFKVNVIERKHDIFRELWGEYCKNPSDDKLEHIKYVLKCQYYEETQIFERDKILYLLRTIDKDSELVKDIRSYENEYENSNGIKKLYKNIKKNL